jgi:hypothetical protein
MPLQAVTFMTCILEISVSSLGRDTMQISTVITRRRVYVHYSHSIHHLFLQFLLVNVGMGLHNSYVLIILDHFSISVNTVLPVKLNECR